MIEHQERRHAVPSDQCRAQRPLRELVHSSRWTTALYLHCTLMPLRARPLACLTSRGARNRRRSASARSSSSVRARRLSTRSAQREPGHASTPRGRMHSAERATQREQEKEKSPSEPGIFLRSLCVRRYPRLPLSCHPPSSPCTPPPMAFPRSIAPSLSCCPRASHTAALRFTRVVCTYRSYSALSIPSSRLTRAQTARAPRNTPSPSS